MSFLPSKLNLVDEKKRPVKPYSIVSPAVANQAPDGMKLWLLDLGTLQADPNFNLRAQSIRTAKNPNPHHDYVKYKQIAILIEHPEEGLILYECGSGIGDGSDQDYMKLWPQGVADLFCRVDPDLAQELPEAIRKTGHDISEVKHIILGHLHLDHAGGLEFFRSRRDVKYWVHEVELKHAMWSVASKTDGSYLKHYLDLDANWNTFHEDHVDLFSGITLHLCPGHSPGLCVMQVNLPKDGTMIFTSDHFPTKENYEDGIPQGFLMKDNEAWYRSSTFIKRLHRATGARICYGHDTETFEMYIGEKAYFE